MNIIKVLKSFDIFNSDAIRFLKNKAINIFLLETSDKTGSSVNLASDKNAVNINVINRPKTYSLLVSAKRRIEEKRLKEKQAVKL